MSNLSIKTVLSEKLKASMKSGDKDTLSFCRNLHAAIRKKEIDDRIDLDDAGVQKIISVLCKQRQDSVEQFAKGGREDLVKKERAELVFLQAFLPPQLSPEEIQKIIDEAIVETKAKEAKDLGSVMKLVAPKTQGRADGKAVNNMVKKSLGIQT